MSRRECSLHIAGILHREENQPLKVQRGDYRRLAVGLRGNSAEKMTTADLGGVIALAILRRRRYMKGLFQFVAAISFALAAQAGVSQVASGKPHFMGSESCRKCRADAYDGSKQRYFSKRGDDSFSFRLR